MKKSLLAVAVAAALPTFAQAQSSVTLFGILDASVEYSNANANASTPATAPAGVSATGVPTAAQAALPFQEGKAGMRVNSGTQSGTRVGIRGSEDIGGGLKGIFTIEHRLDLSTGDTGGGSPFLLAGQTNTTTNNKFWNGQAWVGVEGNFGALTLGRQYTPIFWMFLPVDFTVYGFYNNWAAATGSNTGPAGTATVQGPFRLDNSIAYKSPTFGGLTVWATYAFGENLTNNPAASTVPSADRAGTGDVWGVAAAWRLGGLYLGAGYHSADLKAVAGVQAIVPTSIMAATASYRWTNFGVSLGYTTIDLEQRSATALATPKITNMMLGAFANIGPGTLFLNAINQSFDSFIGARNDSGLQLGLAYSVPLSKRTNWYVALGTNDYSGAQATTATTLVDSQQRVSIGVRHLF